ncbi:MAG: NAD(P)H-dependent oxidoreductase [Hyphomicrobiaceae bacterium]
MSTDVKLLFFAGSAREGSFNKRLARLGADIANANGIESTFVDLSDYPMPIYHGDLEVESGPPDNAKAFKELMQQHDGIFITCPEYNSSVTPLLKNTLDWVSRVRDETEAPLHVYKSRVFAIGGSSPGGFGAMRSLIDLRKILQLGLGAHVLPEQIAVPRAANAFDDNGHLEDKSLQELYKSIIQHLAYSAQALRR